MSLEDKMNDEDSLQVLHDVGEWAARFVGLLLQALEAFVRVCVRLPLGSELKVVFHALVANVKVIVTPVRRGKLGSRDELTDKVFVAAVDLPGLSLPVDVVKDSA